jgi:hypothetical protein
MDKTRYLVGEPIWAEVRVSNPDSAMITAWLSPGLAAVSGIQVFSSDGREVASHCRDPRIATPVTVVMPPGKTAFLARVDLPRCFGDKKEGGIPTGRYGMRARFTTLSEDQAVTDSIGFEVAEPEGPEKELYRELRRTQNRARTERLFRKRSRSAYATLLALKYFRGVTPNAGKKVLLRGVELCQELIAQGPDLISSAVLVDSVAALSTRLENKDRARKALAEIATRHPGTASCEAAQAALKHMGGAGK